MTRSLEWAGCPAAFRFGYASAFNEQVTFSDATLQGMHFRLHPVQRTSSDTLTRQSSFDSKAGAATVGALTTAVFVSNGR